ncbi:hypothetical protein [Nocardioides ungokensis]|uniref:hypothetical protein n=1 Tax=Nocardioides ungokensis TaxID=1643322 RepID=UPI0015DF087A|nr:hypothetical protein [Nocardioides ungokensis]
MRVRRRSGVVAATAIIMSLPLLCGALTGCDDGGAQPGPTLRSGSTEPSAPKAQLTFGVYGPKDETSEFQGVVDSFNAQSAESRVRLHTWSSHGAMMADLRSGGGPASHLPDIFMASRSDLRWLQGKHLTQPVDELLDERGIDFGDGYSRDALEAFSADNRCSACRTRSRRWSSTTTPGWSTSRR